MKRYLMSSLVRLVRPLAKIIHVNEPRLKKKQINKTKEK